MSGIYNRIQEFMSTDSSIAIATVIDTSGSTPQKHGSTALFNKDGLLAGTVGGGVLEGKVQQLSMAAIKTKKSGLYHFLLNKDISFRQDAICGGEATILVDVASYLNPGLFIDIRKSVKEKIPGILLTIISGAEETDKQISRQWVTAADNSNIPKKYSAELGPVMQKLLSERNDSFVKLEIAINDESVIVLLESLFPPLKLIIAGAGHIGKSLSHIGRLLDFEVTVVDDRPEYANIDNIPDADNIIVDNIGKTMESIVKNDKTFIVIVTRGHDDDAKALLPCINSGAAYVGMIGSKSKVSKMHLNFIQNGWATEEQWSRIHTPIGLDINSKTVEEIAVSIAAQLILVRNS
jgi:xanthine dehydrogenase accessory factor